MTGRLRPRPTARRTQIAAMAALLAASVLTACSGDTDPDARDEAEDDSLAECQPAAPAGTFSYTDGRGKKIQLDAIPSTVVAQSSVAAALWDAGYQVDGVYGEVPDEPLEGDRQLGSLDTSEIDVIGKTYGEFDADAYALMDPDLLIDYTFDEKSLWYVPAKQAKQIEGLAPSVGVSGTPKSIDEAIAGFVDLAGRLGADTTCNEEVNGAKADYQEAIDELSTQAEDEPLEVLVASATEDEFYPVNPSTLPETRTLSEAGLNLVEPAAKPSDIFEALSWEQASDFASADVILFDGRATPSVRKTLEGIDTWANLPAVKAGQVYTWYAGAPYSYQEYADIFGELSDQLETAKPLD